MAFSFFNTLFLYVITPRTNNSFIYILIFILSIIGFLFLFPLYQYFLRKIPPLLEDILILLKLGSAPKPHEALAGNEQGFRVESSLIRRGRKNLYQIFYYVMLIMIFTIGSYLRSKCYFNPNTSLWADEANVVIWFLNDGLFHTIFEKIPIRPIGYMFLSFFLMKIYNIDWLMKLSSFIPSVLSMVIVYLLSQRMFQSRLISLVAVFMVSINPQLIFFGNEFKPYALEFFLHLLTLYTSIKYIQEGSLTSLLFTISSCFISIFFTMNIMFALPSVMLVLSMISLREKKYDHLFVILISSLIFLAYLTLIAGFLWSHIEVGTRETVQFYGNKYQTFYVGDNILGHLWWVIQKTGGLIYKSLESKIFFFSSTHWASALAVIYSLLYIAGLVICVIKKKYEFMILFLLPVLTAVLFNLLGLIPYGPDRVNLYLYVYFPMLVFLTIDSLYAIHHKALKILLPTIIVAFFFILQFPHQPNFFKYKLFWSCQTFTKEAIRYIHENNKKEPGQAICLSAPSIRAFNYYARFAKGYSEKYGQDLIRYFQIYEMWTLKDQEICKFMKDIFLNNKTVCVYLANPLTIEEERSIIDSLNMYSSNIRPYLLENSLPVEGLVREKIFYAESLIYQGRGKRAQRDSPPFID